MPVELVALVNQHGGQVFRRISAGDQCLHIPRDLLPLPAEVVLAAHARMGTAVAHGDEHVILLEPDGGLVDLLAANIHLGLGIIVLLVIPDDDDVGIIVLDDLRNLVVQKMDDGEGGVGHASHRAYGQGCGNRRHAFLNRKPCCHHR